MVRFKVQNYLISNTIIHHTDHLSFIYHLFEEKFEISLVYHLLHDE